MRVKNYITTAAVTMLAVSGVLLTASAVHAAPGDEVTFVDANLQTCVNSELGQSADDEVTEAQMSTIEILTCDYAGVTNLQGLQYATSLDTLYLASNEITDVSALAGLNQLDYLELYGNQISDVSALAGLNQLTTLSLSSNQISDVSALAELSELTALYLDVNEISDVSALAGLDQLTTLYLTRNEISDVSALAGLDQLTELYLTRNQISDVSALAGLTNIKGLSLDKNQIVDVSALAGFDQLIDLDLANNQIVDVSALAGLTQLTDLDLTDQFGVQPDVVVGVPVGNPLIGVDGMSIPVSDATLCVAAGCANLVYPIIGTAIPTAWAANVTIGSATSMFSGSFDRNVVAAPPAVVAPTLTGTPATGVVAKPYSYQFTVTGTPASTVALTSGTLPDGLTLSSSGSLIGTPTIAGSFPIELRAENGVDPAATLKTTITITQDLVAPTLSALSPTVVAGEKQKVTGTGFTPGQSVSFVMHSDPLSVGAATADATGTVTLTFIVPTGTPVGEHTVVATQGVLTASTSFAVIAASDTNVPTPSSSASTGALANTGTNTPPFGAGIGLALAATGTMALIIRRRKNQAKI